MKPLILFLLLITACNSHVINGLSMKEAVILNYPTLQEAEDFEKKVITQLYPKHEIVGKLLIRKGKRRFHQYVMRIDGKQEFFYFDVTKYFPNS